MYAFADRPDKSVYVLWYPTPIDQQELGLPSVFVDRNYDRLENLAQTIVGTDQSYWLKYLGRLPTPVAHEPCGSPQQWVEGVSYVTYRAGGYQCDCPPLDYLPAFLEGQSTVALQPSARFVRSILLGRVPIGVLPLARFVRRLFFGSVFAAVYPAATFAVGSFLLLESDGFILDETGDPILEE